MLAALFPGGLQASATGDTPAGARPRPHDSGLPATEWIITPSVEDLIHALTQGATALFFDGQLMSLFVETSEGNRIVSFAPDRPAEALVVVPTPELLGSLATDGLALVITGGRTVPATAGSPFTPATDSPRLQEFLDRRTRSGAADDTDHTAPAAISRPQSLWSQTHGAHFTPVSTGPNAFFDTVITAVGGRLSGNGRQATDATMIRAALAQRIRDMAATDALRDWPAIQSAFLYAGEARILTDYFGNDPAEVVRQVLHTQLNDHIKSGEAWKFIETAITRPGHWDQITDQLAPDLLADLFDLNLIIIDPHGRARMHGDPGGRRLIIARTRADTATQSGWAAVTPDPRTRDTTTSPLHDLAVDTATTLAKASTTGTLATLNPDQRNTAADQQLRIEPTPTGATSFSSAVLTAAGGGFLLDSDTYISSAEQLRRTLAGMLRDRPDILPPTAHEQINAIAGPVDDRVIEIINDPANPTGDQLTEHLVAPYLGIRLRIIGTDGTIADQGAGQQITIAATTGQDGQPHWAALVPTVHASLAGLGLPTMPGLPDLLQFHQPASATPWNTNDYKTLEPNAGKIDDPWRDSTFSRNEFGESVYCVSVTVITKPSLVA
jgi:hypothetical protein